MSEATYKGGVENALYWSIHEKLEPRHYNELAAIARGHSPFPNRAFEVAYLIAIGCLDYDMETNQVTGVTKKGWDALNFYLPHRFPEGAHDRE